MGYRIDDASAGSFYIKHEDGGWIATFAFREHAEAFLKLLQPKPAGPTVRCRALAVVGLQGQWEITGRGDTLGSDGGDPANREWLRMRGFVPPTGAEYHPIEFTLPIPQRVEPQVIEGTVVE